MTDYLKSIVSVREKHAEKSFDGKIDIQLIAAKYSNTKKPIYKIMLDNKPISRNNSYLVKYACLTCNTIQEITLNLFVRKISQEGKCCVVCRNQDEEKSKTHSEFMKLNAKSVINGTYEKPEKELNKSLTLLEHLAKSETDWNMEDDDFKSRYELQHLTVSEFERIRNIIKGVNNEKIKDLSGWDYIPNYRVWNQTRYTPMLVNKTLNLVEKPYYVTFDCENCESRFCHRDIEIVKNKLKIYCKDCSFTNRTFRIRTLTMKNGEKIKWQSIPERRFIEWCEENSISIKNGPNIEYEFDGSKKTYKVDFELPSYKYLVELKDNHCWYKQQVLSGKQPAKEIAAKKWCESNKYKYHMLFPKTIQEFKTKLKSCKI